MAKQTWAPGTMISPLPPALIASGNMTSPNVMTAAWTGIICSDPVITYVSIRPSRYSHELISQSKEFTINVPTWKIASAVDTVGVKTGRNINKFELTGLTPEPCTKISAPQVKECPISIECKVLEVRSFGTHDMFLAEVVAVNVDEQYIEENNALNLEKAGLLAYAHGFYYTLGRKIGKFGFSVEKKEANKTITLKTDEKINKEKNISKLNNLKSDETFIENGVEVIVKKTKLTSTDKTPKDKASQTHKKSDEKFGKKRTISKFNKARSNEKFVENGVEVIIEKTKFKKTEKPEKNKTQPTSRKTDKFSKKTSKKTNYEPYSFKKKPDGSFKKNKSK